MADETQNRTRFEYDLRHFESEEYLATMYESLISLNAVMPHSLGESIPLTDDMLGPSNSRRLRKCFIERIKLDETNPNFYTLYLRPTREEVKPQYSLIIQRFSRKCLNGVDWDGLDGWLTPA